MPRTIPSLVSSSGNNQHKESRMKELIQVTTQDISKAKPVASTRVIADQFGKRHADVIRKVESLINDPNSSFFNERKIALAEYSDKKGELRKEYLLTRDQFSFVVMGFTGKESTKFKEDFIQAFNKMEHELLARAETRHIGKQVRHSLTDSISENLEDNTTHKKFAFSNYTKLIYKKVLGCTVKKFKEANNLKDSDNVRDHLTIEQLSQVQALESKIAVLIEGFTTVMTDKEVYQKVKDMVDK